MYAQIYAGILIDISFNSSYFLCVIEKLGDFTAISVFFISHVIANDMEEITQ